MSSASRRLSSLSTQIRSSSTMSRTMKEAVVSKGPKITIRDVPVPRPGPGQVVTKVVFSGCNPKDWKYPSLVPDADPINQGDDIAGYIEEVGADVHEFKKGDRVAAFHEMRKPGGSYAEYAVSWASTTWPLPDNVTFEQGAAIPLAALTAAVGLYDRLRLPEPWVPAKDGQKIPLVIYGASSAVGAYVIQFARKSNIHPLICVAGRAKSHVESLIDSSKGDVYIDYRQGEDKVAGAIKAALKGEKLQHAYDAVSEKGSYQTIVKVLEPNGKLTLVLPGKKYPEIPDTVEQSVTTVGDVHGFPHNLWDLGFVYSKYIGRALQEGWFKPQPHEVVPGGLEGIETGLTRLKDGTASAVKYVYKIADTPGVKSD